RNGRPHPQDHAAIEKGRGREVGLPERSDSLRIGELAAEYLADYSLDHIEAYEDVVPHYKGIHNSPEAAARSGFNQTFASGTRLVAHVIENLMPPVFGEGWTHHGALNCA